MSQTKYQNCPATGLVSLAVAMLLVATASLAHAQANNAQFWNVTGPADWSALSNWTPGYFDNSYSAGEFAGGSIVNGGTANITSLDNPATDTSGYGCVLVGANGNGSST